LRQPLGVGLACYVSVERKADSIHEDLFTRVIVLEYNNEDFIFAQNDLTDIDYRF